MNRVFALARTTDTTRGAIAPEKAPRTTLFGVDADVIVVFRKNIYLGISRFYVRWSRFSLLSYPR